MAVALTVALLPPAVWGFCSMQSHFLKVEYKLPKTSVPIEHAMRLIHTPERLFSYGEYMGMRTSLLKSDLPERNGTNTSVRMCLRMGWNVQELRMFTLLHRISVSEQCALHLAGDAFDSLSALVSRLLTNDFAGEASGTVPSASGPLGRPRAHHEGGCAIGSCDGEDA
jgi:hypothetical protein